MEPQSNHKAVPVFRSAEEQFAADACQPLVTAASREEIELQALVHGHYPGRRLPSGVMQGVKTVGYWNAVEPQSWGLSWHRNEGVELTYLESGTLDFGAEEQAYGLSAGHLTITRPWQRHRIGNPVIGPSRLNWLILDVGVRRPNQPWRWPPWIVLQPSDLEELANVLRCTEQHIWRASGEIRHCFLAIAEAVEASNWESHLSHLTVRINELLLLVLELLRSQNPRLNLELTSSHRTVKLLLDDLATHPECLSEEWTLTRMAESCGLGVTQFVQVVKQLVNKTPFDYLNHHRLNHAARLLRTSPKESITEIAQICGFSTSQYFGTVFRRHYGCTPSAFRDNAVRAPASKRRAGGDWRRVSTARQPGAAPGGAPRS